MIRRAMLVLTVALLLAVVIAPAAQARSGYPVKNAKGQKIGSVTAGSHGKVWDHSGIQTGEYGPSGEERWVTSPRKYGHHGTLSKHSDREYSVVGDAGTGSGRAFKKDGRWLLQQKVKGSWVTRGSAPLKVSGWAGAAALWVLVAR